MNGINTITEASRLTGISRETLLSWANRGMIKSEKGESATSPLLVSLTDIWDFIRTRYRPAQMLQKAGIGFVTPAWAKESLDDES